jgi:CheY-like chemotaxis protein
MTCPRCGLKNIRHSPRRGLIDGVLAVLFLAPFRCRHCRHRFFRFSKRIGNDFILTHSGPASSALAPHLDESRNTPPPDELAIDIETPRSILIIDDDLAIRKLLQRVLERHGYCTSELDDDKDLASELASNPVDLLITSFVSERQGGLESIAGLHRAYPDLKIIVLSSYWAAETYLTKELPGGLAILPKPFLSESLLHSVRAALDLSSGSRVAE